MDPALRPIDYGILALYFLFVGAVGFGAARRSRTAEEYFLGGRALPWWAASLSILATETSAVTFIGVPRASYAGDWSFLELVLGFVLGRVFLAFVFVPAFYAGRNLTVYGLLGERFGPLSRTLASVLFITGRLVASSVRLFAGCFALHVAAGLDLFACIVALGAFGTLFTLRGGIRSVVWTDAVMGLTLVAGGAAALVFALRGLPEGLSSALEFLATGEAETKFRVFHPFEGLGDARSFVAGLLGGFALTLATHGTDQDIAQRVLTCRDSRRGAWSLIGSAVAILPLMALFLALGTALYLYERSGSAPWPPPDDANRVVPLFIRSALPPGLAGFVLAGLVAAALSSFTSVLNALASTAVDDLYRPLFAPNGGGARDTDRDGGIVRISRAVTLAFAILLIGGASFFAGTQESIIELALEALTYFYGGFLGAFLLALLTRRGSDLSVACGMLASVPLVLLFKLRLLLESPGKAPPLLRAATGAIPESTRAFLLEAVPAVAWPYWTILAALLAAGIGALGRRR